MTTSLNHELEIDGEASKRLIDAYMSFAEQCEAAEDYAGAVSYLEKCIQRAKECHDIDAVVNISIYFIG